MKSRPPHKVLAEPYKAARRIIDAFPVSPSDKIPPAEIESREKLLRRELHTLCVHLISMAEAEIRSKGLHERNHDPEFEKVKVHDAACIAISFLFDRRKRSGLREIVEIIRSLFRRNPDAGPVDLFNYLKAVVSRNLSQSAKQKARFDNPWFYCVARCVDFHVRSRSRYTVKGKLIIDLESQKSSGPSRMATSEDILSLCNHFSPMPKKPGAAVDFIFDCLIESNQFDGRIERQELYLAVYKLMTPHMSVEYTRNSVPTPDEDCLVSSMHVEAYDLLGGMEESYNWRKIQDSDLRAAYLSAGEDILMDLIYFGKRRMSLYECLSAHIDGFTQKDWREHKGSFQHFVKVLIKKWFERFRAL